MEYNSMTDNKSYGIGKVNFYNQTESGVMIHSATKYVQIVIDHSEGFMKSFAESLRKATFNAKESMKQANAVRPLGKAVYELSGTLAVCDLVMDNNGIYINKLPIAMMKWESYGMEEK